MLLDGEDIYGRGVDVVDLRRRVGMVFQKSNPFPKSIFENVAYGLRVGGHEGQGASSPSGWRRRLRSAALWDEVKDRLDDSALALSGGQQQRLCIARALAVEPEVLLMDEPACALDPIATAKIEELIHELKERYTIVIVTHNMQQAARVSRLHRLLLHGRAGRVRRHRADLHQPAREARPRTTSPGSSGERARARCQRRIPTRRSSRSCATCARSCSPWAAKVEELIADSVRALTERDSALGRAGDRGATSEVNRLEVEIDELCRRILALRQPAASDLRFITTALKIVTDLERIGDLAVNIAERAIDLNQAPPLTPYVDLPQLAELAQAQVQEGARRLRRRATWTRPRRSSRETTSSTPST